MSKLMRHLLFWALSITVALSPITSPADIIFTPISQIRCVSAFYEMDCADQSSADEELCAEDFSHFEAAIFVGDGDFYCSAYGSASQNSHIESSSIITSGYVSGHGSNGEHGQYGSAGGGGTSSSLITFELLVPAVYSYAAWTNGSQYDPIGFSNVTFRYLDGDIINSPTGTLEPGLFSLACSAGASGYSDGDCWASFSANLTFEAIGPGPEFVWAYPYDAVAGSDISIQTEIIARSEPISEVSIFYRIDDGPEYMQVANNDGSEVWVASIGQHSADTQIAWRIVARDHGGNEALWPSDGGLLSFFVLSELRSAVAWGRNTHGQCDIQEPNEGFVMVSGGGSHSLGLRWDGSIMAWGNNTHGQCNVPSPNINFVAVAAGANHSLGLKMNGSIVAWGDNSSAQCNAPADSTYLAIAAGSGFSVGLKSNGSAQIWGDMCWGDPHCSPYGQIPSSDIVSISAGSGYCLFLKADGTVSVRQVNWDAVGLPEQNMDFLKISAGGGHCLGLKSDGSIEAWGWNNFYGQCDIPEPNAGFVEIAAGGEHSLGIRQDGSLLAWGSNYYGQSGIPDGSFSFLGIACGRHHSLAILASQLMPKILSAVVVDAFAGADISMTSTVEAGGVSISAVTLLYRVGEGSEQTVAANSEGNDQWTASFGQFPGNTQIFWRLVARDELDNIVQWPNDGSNLTFTVITPGPIAAWGLNNDGQCDVPEPNISFVAVAGGERHSLGLRDDGVIMAWGYNAYGQCNVPGPNADFVAVIGGGRHSLGLKNDGSIVAWGLNNYGQCNVPSPNENFITISAGYAHNLGLRNDGTILAWGTNNEGQCDVPEPNERFMSIAAGRFHSLALKTDGTIVAWGLNDEGQCDVPEPNSGFVSLIAGNAHSLGLKNDGSIVTWGWNDSGQCDVPEPNEDFVALAAGWDHSLGLRDNGEIAAWGSNSSGQGEVPEPNSGFVTVAASLWHSLSIRGISSTSVSEDPGVSSIPTALAIRAVAPNPFNPRTTIWLDLPKSGALTLAIHDLRGRLVRMLWRGHQDAGRPLFVWDGLDDLGQQAASGVYVVRMVSAEGQKVDKVTLVK